MQLAMSRSGLTTSQTASSQVSEAAKRLGGPLCSLLVGRKGRQLSLPAEGLSQLTKCSVQRHVFNPISLERKASGVRSLQDNNLGCE
jgi:hypothetical protein